jgi:uncharacterized protein (TIGR00730 family)
VEFHSVCVYCGSADHLNSVYLDEARAMGRQLASNGIRLIYGAGKTGLMGALADGVLEAGGEVIGVVPVNLNTPQLIHSRLSQLEIVPDIHQRKARMIALAEAFIALPGGYGTFDELFETLTWAQIGLHQKPIGLLNIRNYFDPLLKMVENAWVEGFIYPGHEKLLVVDQDPAGLLTRLKEYTSPPGLERWVNRPEE